MSVLVGILAFSLFRTRRQLDAARKSATAAASGLKALERATTVADERERIYRDLHDDIGAKLLDLALTSDDPVHSDLARAVLQDLRDVVSRSRGEPGALLDVLADIKQESENRMASLGIELSWISEAGLPNPGLDHADALHLHRIVREALTNAVRHARPARIRIRVQSLGDELLIDITDEGGVIENTAVKGTGSGITGMKARAEELQGSIRWDPGTMGGTKVILKFPLTPGEPG